MTEVIKLGWLIHHIWEALPQADQEFRQRFQQALESSAWSMSGLEHIDFEKALRLFRAGLLDGELPNEYRRTLSNACYAYFPEEEIESLAEPEFSTWEEIVWQGFTETDAYSGMNLDSGTPGVNAIGEALRGMEEWRHHWVDKALQNPRLLPSPLHPDGTPWTHESLHEQLRKDITFKKLEKNTLMHPFRKGHI